jgi:hypothetical protein
MRVVELTDGLSEAYGAFLRRRPTSLVYQSLAYQRLLTQLLPAEQRSLVVLDNGAIRGALPLLSRQGPYGRVYNSLPYYGSHGGVIADDAASAGMLISALNEIASADDTAAATLVANPLEAVDYGALAHDLTDFRIGQWTPIDYPAEHAQRLMDTFHSKTRNMVRKAEKGGVKVARDEGALDFIATVHRENMAEIGGRAKAPRFFELVAACFRAGAEFRVTIARLDGTPVAGLLAFYFNRTVEYFTPVVRKEHRDTQALSLAIFAAMTEASQEGYRWWNWGGTWASQDGVYRFKKRWGSLDKRYTYYTRVRNAALKEIAAPQLLQAYPDFYVRPF